MLKEVKYGKIRGKICAIEIHDNHIRIVPIDKVGGIVNYVLNGLDTIIKDEVKTE